MALKRLRSQPPCSYSQPSKRISLPPVISIKNDDYKVEEEYGRGSYGIVARVTRGTNEFACKGIFKKDDEENQQYHNRVLNELLIQREFDHLYICKLKDDAIGHNTRVSYLLQELCKKETLWYMINKRNGITEIEARFFSIQILQGLKEIHGKDIIHHDLKPENILLDQNTLYSKISDFGLSEKLVDGIRLFYRRGGTLPYMAPEVLHDPNDNGHTLAADIWSFGIMLVYMVARKHPYEGRSYTDLYNNIKTSSRVDLSGINISDSLKIAIESILKFNPAERPTADQILRLKWFLEDVPITLPESVIYREPKFNEEAQVIKESSEEPPKEPLKEPTKELSKSIKIAQEPTDYMPIETLSPYLESSPFPSDFSDFINHLNSTSSKQEVSLVNDLPTPDIRSSYSSVELPSPIVYTASIGIDKDDNLYDHYEE